NDGDHGVVSTRDVRMSIDIVGRPVCGPTGVRNAEAPGSWPFAEEVREARDPPRPLAQVELSPGNGGQPGAIVPTILQPPQSLDQQWLGFALPDVSNNPAHDAHLRGLQANWGESIRANGDRRKCGFLMRQDGEGGRTAYRPLAKSRLFSGTRA